MERETRKFKTKGGFEIELKTYINFGESREIQSVFLDNFDVSIGGDGEAKAGGLNAGLAMKAQDKAIELLVVSVNGIKENILESVKNLPVEDGNEIIAELDKIQKPISDQKKTT